MSVLSTLQLPEQVRCVLAALAHMFAPWAELPAGCIPLCAVVVREDFLDVSGISEPVEAVDTLTDHGFDEEAALGPSS